MTLNGKTGKPSIARSFIGALNDERIITEKGGFLFKALATGDRLVLGVTPCFIDGERTYHYDTRLPGEDEFTLIGSVIPDGTFEIFFRPLSKELSPEDIRKYADSYVIFARFLLENGYSGHGRLDTVTVSMLREARLFHPAPEDLAGLASVDCSLDEQAPEGFQ
ncbi:MAG: hypothetical protein GQ565_10125 [Candidatus Aegiribacteria sp.]|nr:hypothetical protein [Candidatus Aegiribacteria sp.]